MRLIQQSLERTESVQELERRWRKDEAVTATFEAFASRLEEMHGHARFRQVCDETAARPGLSKDKRDDFQMSPLLLGVTTTPNGYPARRLAPNSSAMANDS